MEIEFNPSNLNPLNPAKPAERQDPVRPVTEDASFQKTATLEAKLKEIPLSRPGKVERARELVADVQYPPEAVLNSLANLLAIKIK